MKLDLDSCRFLSGKSGIPLDFIIKEFHVFDVLRQITLLNVGTNKLIFKGGTALNKVYLGDLQRFSEDLDFDLSNATLREVISYSKELALKIEGFEVTEFRRVRGTFMFSCVFESPLGKKDHVRVDISGKKFSTSKSIEIGTATSMFVDRTVSGFQIYSFDDLVARKLNALCDRAEGKDVYDVAMSIDNTNDIKSAIKKALESEGKQISVEDFLDKCTEKLEKINSKNCAI